MPCYPAFALLLGSALASTADWIRYGTRLLGGIFALAALALVTLYFLAWNLPAPGDISAALSSNPGAYKLSLGHMEDLTIASFAYLRVPLLLAAIAFLVGAAGAFRGTGQPRGCRSHPRHHHGPAPQKNSSRQHTITSAENPAN